MKPKKLKNYGLNLQKERDECSDKDHVFGGLSKLCLAQIPPEKREFYFPQGELQNIGEEKMDCASRSPLNILETKFNWLIQNDKISKENKEWLIENGYMTVNGVEFSDAFTAIKSGTTEEGNSLKAPLESIRKEGIIPKSMLPQTNTWEEHHNSNRITEKIKNLGEEFAERFTIKYEKVFEQQYNDLIIKDLLNVAGYAWPEIKNGEYGKVDYTPNHAFMIYKPLYYVFDNYIESEGDFIKKLAADYNFLDYGYRVYLESEQIPKKWWLLNWLF